MGADTFAAALLFFLLLRLFFLVEVEAVESGGGKEESENANGVPANRVSKSSIKGELWDPKSSRRLASRASYRSSLILALRACSTANRSRSILWEAAETLESPRPHCSGVMRKDRRWTGEADGITISVSVGLVAGRYKLREPGAVATLLYNAAKSA